MLLGSSSGDQIPDIGAAVTGGDDDGGVPDGRILREFAEAVVGDDDARASRSRSVIRDRLGDEQLVDCAGVVALFNAINRVADATGTRLDEILESLSADVRATFGID